MNFAEAVLNFECEGEPLVGILSQPARPQGRLGVIIIVGGPQYRAGSHRQFTLLARHLAAEGFPTLRFDYRGMGDSGGAARDFQGVDADIGAAIGLMCASGVERVVLWGLCDAASAALLYLQSKPDPRVAGLVLANPWVRSAASLAQAQVKHYYGQRLREKAFWRKLLLGGVGLQALRDLSRNLRQARKKAPASPTLSFQDRMAAGLSAFPGQVLLLLSGEDLTAKEFLDHAATSPAWRSRLAGPRLTRADFAPADHTFSLIAHANEVNARTADWLRQLQP